MFIVRVNNAREKGKVELEHWKHSQLLRVKRVKQDESLHESDTTFSNQEQETSWAGKQSGSK